MRDSAMREPRKRITQMRYGEGPMAYLADQIMKEHQRAGYAPREFNLYRPAQAQIGLVKRGVSKAPPYQSAHQYYCASDIIDERWAWFAKKNADGSPTGAPDGSLFWDRLWDCVEVVSEKFEVEFSERLSWDPAHIQLANWRDFKSLVGQREPTKYELIDWFKSVLPRVYAGYERQQNARLTAPE